MKRTLIFAALTCAFLASCSNSEKKAETTDAIATDTTAIVPMDTNATDTGTVVQDTAAVDSATKAHGHAH